MANFWKLVQNENMKIYRRAATLIMLAFVVFIPILVTVGFVLLSDGADVNMWEMMQLQTMIVFILITIFTVVKSADSVAGEFSSGTIKLLLIRPWSRSTILLSKFVSLLLFALLLSAICFIVSWGINAVFLGYDANPGGLIPPTSPMAGGSPWAYMLTYYLYEWIVLVVIVSFAFMLSAAFRSGGLAIGLSIFILLSGSLITGILGAMDKPWVKYVLFSNLDLTSYLGGGAPLPGRGMTLGFSLAVLAAYFIVFNLVSWIVFRKRDVAA